MRISLFIALLVGSLCLRGQVLINEVCPSNKDIIYDSTFYNFSGWVELYNPSGSSQDISGYYLSDSFGDTQRWAFPPGTTVPANGYLIVWLDNENTLLHTNFSVETKGDEIVLSSPTSVVDQVVFPIQYINTSYGRISDGNPVWTQSPVPTPMKPNVTGPTSGNGPLPKVEFNLPSGRYAGTVSVSLSQIQAGSEIRYTTDGAEPTTKSLLYSAPFDVALTSVVKAKAFHPDYLPSETISVTYFINEHEFSLPVVSLSADPRYMFNDTIGIYVQGTNGVPGNCFPSPANWNMDWDRHFIFEYLDDDGNRKFYQHINLRLAGNCSRRRPQKSFSLKAKQEYGSGKFEYKFFQTKSLKKYDEFFLRNAGGDQNIAHCRDGFMQTLPIGFMDLDYLAYQPTTLYINGQYWGIQNLREKIDADYVENNYGIVKEDIDLNEDTYKSIEGTLDAWNNYLDSLTLLNPTDPNTFKFIEKHVDVKEYINYLVLETYYANFDWANNIKFWRQRSTNGKFRWILYDTDQGFGYFDDQAQHPTLDYITDPAGSGNNRPGFTRPIRLVLAVPEFRDRFVATMATAMGSVLEPSRVIGVINQFEDRLENEMPYHKLRWGGSISSWYSEMQVLRDYALERRTFMETHVGNYFGLNQTGLTASTSPANTGQIEINGIASTNITYAPFYEGVSLNLKALPRIGFKLKDWTISESVGSEISIAQSGDDWKYFDSGTLPAPDWKSETYSDAAWKQGPSQLGYGDGDEQTVVCSKTTSCVQFPTGSKFVTTYFRRSFNIADTSRVFNFAGSVLFDDGVVVYVNGHEVYRGNMPAGTISNSTLASADQAYDDLFFPFVIPRNFLVNGVNTVSAEVHQRVATSSDLSFDLKASLFEFGAPVAETVYTTDVVKDTAWYSTQVLATFEPVEALSTLVINEISATNTGILDDAGQAEDWIELYNTGSTAVNLQGLMITDDPSQKAKFQLRKEGEWLLQPGAYQVLWADDDEGQGPNHLSFKLSSQGEQIFIYQMVGFDTVEIASHTFGPQPDGFSLSRIPNGTGQFENTFNKTLGEANVQEPLAVNLVLNEFSATPSLASDGAGDKEDWIELYNSGSSPINLNGMFITDTATNKFKHMLNNFGQSWILPAGGYQVLWADNEIEEGSDHLTFKLSGSGETIGLYQLTGGDTVELLLMDFSKQRNGFSSARIPNGTGPLVPTYAITPGAQNKAGTLETGLVLNEFSSQTSTAQDEAGDADDWIELFNAGSQAVDLSALFITDNPENELKHPLYTPTPWLLQPGGYQVLWADNEPTEGINHLSFKLSSAGDEIAMYQLLGGDTVEIWKETYTFQSPGFSTSRIPNGTGPFELTSIITPGAENIENEDSQFLYPNPSDTQFKILLKEENATFSIYDQFGRKVTTYYFSTPHEATIDVNDYMSGFYFVKIVYPSHTVSQTLIIAH